MSTFHQFLNEKLYKNQLNPKFWDVYLQFDPDLRKKILEICEDFTQELEITDLVDDIVLTGSLANYNYTRYSDLDVHILLDFNKINTDTQLVKSNLDGKRFIWNLRHDITFRGHEIELYFQDTEEPHVASGLFSILNDKWIKQPKYDPPSVQLDYVYYKRDQLIQEILRLESKLHENDNNAEELHKRSIKLREKITKMRKDSLQDHGEYGTGNLVFKELRNKGFIEKIINISNQAYDKIYSENYK